MKYKTYKIQKGDTLESIAKKLNVSLFELRNFHNNHCELQDLLGPYLPKYLTFILIPDQENTETETGNQQQEIKIELKNNFLSFYPTFGKPITYEVSCTLEKGNNLNNFYYLITVLPEKDKDGNFIVTLSRDNVYINGQEAYLNEEKLALQGSQAIYPVRIMTNPQGQFLKVANFEELGKQWKKKNREEKYPLYVGDVVEKYLMLAQETLENEKKLYQNLLHDLFIAVYFNSGIYTRYDDFESEQLRFFPIRSFCAPAEFTVTQKINPILNTDNFLELTQEGIITDLREKEDFIYKENLPLTFLQGKTPKPVEGHLRADYLLHPLTHAIQSVELKCRAELEKTLHIRVSINNLKKEKPYYKNTSHSFLVE